MVIWELHSVIRHEVCSATATDVQLAGRSTTLQQRPNAHYRSQAAGHTEARLSEGPRPGGGHYQQTVISD